MQDLVWYVSYGSNLCRDRFMCYIGGSQLKGSSKIYKGCSDKTSPNDIKPIEIPYELYFSKESSNWENKAVAFVKSQKDEQAKTLGRKYLITKQQFIEVIRQENALEPQDDSFIVDFDKAISRGESFIPSLCWYGRIIFLGNDCGFPMFTFTAKWNDEDISYNTPGQRYLRIISKGIRETYGFSKEEIVNYLENKKGIMGNYPKEKLAGIVLS